MYCEGNIDIEFKLEQLSMSDWRKHLFLKALYPTGVEL